MCRGQPVSVTMMRGIVCVCVALLPGVLLGVEVGGQWTHDQSDTYREENEECRREGGSIWLCKKDKDCPGAKRVLQQGGKLVTCSWRNSTTHIICCPPEEPAANHIRISEKKCEEFQKRLCPKRTLLSGEVLSKQYMNKANPGNALEDYKPPVRQSAIGGELSKPKEFPSMALIGYGDPMSISWQCGGSLVSESFVLSAAHCSLTAYGLARWVRLGDLDINSETDDARPQEFEIIERIVHSGYQEPAFYNDIVLFRLHRAAVFNQYVRPACLHTALIELVGVGVAAGWGRNESYGPRSSALVKVDLKFLSDEDCQRTVGKLNVYLPAGLDTKTMLCAGEPGKDTCQGDSGGPLMWDDQGHLCLDRQVGITSFGPKDCGMSPATGTYVRVAHFVPWIESVVWPE